jgi:hypothetical protein
MIHMSKTITPTEFASEVGTDGRTVRKFLRSITPKESQPGKGSRWELDGTKRGVTTLTKRFNEWKAAQDQARADRDAAKEEATDENEVDDSDMELDETE